MVDWQDNIPTKSTLDKSNIVQPVDVQSQYRIVYQDTTTDLANGGTFTGTTRESRDFSQIRLYVDTDQAGTCYVQEGFGTGSLNSTDNFTFASGQTVAKADLNSNYARIQYVSGGSTSTFEIVTSWLPIGVGDPTS